MGHYTAIMGSMKLTRHAVKHLVVNGLPDWSRLPTLRGIQGHPELDMLIDTNRYDGFGRSASAYHHIASYDHVFDISTIGKHWVKARTVEDYGDEECLESFLAYNPQTREVVFFSSHKDFGQIGLFIGLLRHFTTEYSVLSRYDDREKGTLHVGALSNIGRMRGEGWVFHKQELQIEEHYYGH